MLSCGHRAGRAHQRHASSSLAQGSAGSALTTQTARSWPGAATSTKAAFELIALNEVLRMPAAGARSPAQARARLGRVAHLDAHRGRGRQEAAKQARGGVSVGKSASLAKHVAKVMLVRSQPSPARGACGTPIAAFCALTRACSYPAAAGRLCCDGQVLTRAGKLGQVVQGVGL